MFCLFCFLSICLSTCLASGGGDLSSGSLEGSAVSSVPPAAVASPEGFFSSDPPSPSGGGGEGQLNIIQQLSQYLFCL